MQAENKFIQGNDCSIIPIGVLEFASRNNPKVKFRNGK
jgi:hypothetical protein